MTEEARRAAGEALTAIKALESVTSVGVLYTDYVRRLGDAKIKIDNVSAQITDSEVQISVAHVMTYYERTASSWGDKVREGDKYDPEHHLRIMAEDGCQGAQDVLNQAKREKYPWIIRGVYGVPTMMSCAAGKVAALEQLIQGRKQ